MLANSTSSIRRFHISTTARSTASIPSSGGSGWSSSKYRQIATDSAMQVPSSSSNTGSPRYGFRFSASGVRGEVGALKQVELNHRHRDALLGQEDADAARIGRPGIVIELHATLLPPIVYRHDAGYRGTVATGLAGTGSFATLSA